MNRFNEEKNGFKEQIESMEKKLREASDNLHIPKSLQPMAMKQKLEALKRSKRKQKRILLGFVSAAAIAAVTLLTVWNAEQATKDMNEKEQAETAVEGEERKYSEKRKQGEARAEPVNAAASYAEVYDTLSEIIKRQQSGQLGAGSGLSKEAASGPESGNSVPTGDLVMNDLQLADRTGTQSSGSSYSKTNVQVEGVAEGDLVKTDGDYIYRMNSSKGTVDIIKVNREAMEKAAVLEFHNPAEIYIAEDILIVLEQGYLENKAGGGSYRSMAPHGGGDYTTVYIYDISRRKSPRLRNQLTQSGYLKTTRLQDDCLYIITEEYVRELGSEKDIISYVPQINSKLVAADKIFIPEGCNTSAYLNLTSVDLNHPQQYKDNTSILASGTYFYMNTEHLYLADQKWREAKTDADGYNESFIMKFSIQNGLFQQIGEATIKGAITDSFAINEYDGNLRVVTTVDHYERIDVFDDVNQKSLGYTDYAIKTDNSLYVLDQSLKQIGAIEGLAEEERIYAARFIGAYGYFVTFRETDPLFSVDLSNPAEPKIVGELKIPGFSEYLHFYGEGLLLGIGQEINEDGMNQGIKLSMFDISDPANVVEKDKRVLDGYYYSPALYDYKAVMIDPQKNLFGFMLEGNGPRPLVWREIMAVEDTSATDTSVLENGEEYRRDYGVFSYHPGQGFMGRLLVEDSVDSYQYGNGRGLFMDDIFYLVETAAENIKVYHLKDRKFLGELHQGMPEVPITE